ncbi:hypothetical protein [Culicoidibacter larvae]|uniref:WD40 repeat domain-containing protein n=1 Tax=Culicoidibacter larvae TaxID=2579976 RepID=A0A5R8QGR4_9FIRM|nr:hypothetical protein [Culicoidibacter larvae]TLG77229.1 hypothetical protein FEZ08_01030 [Culicoidibacter larvae]
MQKLLSKKDWKKVFRHFVIIDCAIREHNIVYFLIQHYKNERVRQVVLIDDDHETLDYAYFDLGAISMSLIGAAQKPISQGLRIGCLGGAVFPAGGGKSEWDSEWVGDDMPTAVNRIKMIDGYAWAVGLQRFVSKRIDIGRWQVMTCTAEEVVEEEDAFTQSFEDIAGFSERDIYIVGGKGEVWHYDGRDWKQCQFPSDERLYHVACGNDGFVYVASKEAIWCGKMDDWELVRELKLDYQGLNDLCWFDNRLWGIGDHTFFIWDGSDVADHIVIDGEDCVPHGCMDSTEDLLLICGHSTAWAFDGRDWVNIIPRF